MLGIVQADEFPVFHAMGTLIDGRRLLIVRRPIADVLHRRRAVVRARHATLPDEAGQFRHVRCADGTFRYPLALRFLLSLAVEIRGFIPRWLTHCLIAHCEFSLGYWSNDL